MLRFGKLPRMYRLLFLPFFVLLFLGCDDASDEVDPLFYQVSEADSARCMEEILDGILEDTTEMMRIMSCIYHPNIPYCGIVDVLRIDMNSRGDLMIGNEPDSTNVLEKTYQFFMYNRFLTNVEVEAYWENPSLPGFNYPLYHRYYPKEILRNIEQSQNALAKISEIEGVDHNQVDYYDSRLREWEVKKKAIEILNAPSISQIAFTAHVRFTIIQSTPKSDEVLNDIALAFYQMRNYECMRYFKESYLSLHERAQRRKRTIDIEKLDVLKLLHPASIHRRELRRLSTFELPNPPTLMQPPKSQKP